MGSGLVSGPFEAKIYHAPTGLFPASPPPPHSLEVRLVPRRLTEDAFWSRYFAALRREIQRLLFEVMIHRGSSGKVWLKSC